MSESSNLSGVTKIEIMKLFRILFLGLLLLIPYTFTANETSLVVMETMLKQTQIPNIVTVTTYTVNELAYTASGYAITPETPETENIIAVSRDLKKSFEYGERVLVTGVGEYNGIYVVRDKMHKRWENKIDILIIPTGTHTKLFNARLYHI